MKRIFIISNLLLWVVSLNAQIQDTINENVLRDSSQIKWQLAIKKEQELKEKKLDTIPDNVYWAEKVVAFSSQYDDYNHAAMHVLGKPNSMPAGGDSKVAWCVAEKKGKEREKKGEAYIWVQFKRAKHIQQVVVAENYNPGAITKIEIFDKKGRSKVIYTAQAKAIKEKKRMLSVVLPELTKMKVYQVKVTLQPSKVPGQNQIDAIGISDGTKPVVVKINQIEGMKFTSEPENLGDSINTKYDEVGPMISSDGKTLYFDRRCSPENVGGVKDPDDIWFSIKNENGKWTKAKNIGKPLNTQGSNFVQSITPDGNALLLGNVYKEDGKYMFPGVSFSYRTKNGWSAPVEQKIEGFKNKSKYVSYFLTNDGKYLLMAIKNPEGYGGLDLYVSKKDKQENHWKEPKNLGNVINTVGDEYSPFLAADGQTLYFASNGHPGYGKADIFMAKKLGKSWKKWSEPINLGPVINSDGVDSKYNIPASGEYAYYSSENNSKGKNDIFRIKTPEETKPEPVILITGVVKDKKTGEALDARILVEDLNRTKTANKEDETLSIARTDPASGAFQITLPAGKRYGFRAISLGYFENNKNIDLTLDTVYRELKNVEMLLSPVEVGQVVRLNNIFFETGKSELKPESFLELDRVVFFLKNNPTMEIEIAGHTDDIGSAVANLKLSQDRAQAVANYISSKGISSKRLKVVGYGETRPLKENIDDESRQFNRRVEFKVLKK